jgi:tetratricopeptide (TPR) repeat protein
MMRDAGQYVHEMIALVAGFEALGDVRNACLQRVNLADAYIHVGDYREGASVARAALALGVDLGVSLTSVNAKHNLARALCELGELEEARRHAEEALAEIRLGQDHRMVAASLGHLARILMKMGDLSAAEATARASLAMEKAPAPVRSLSSARLAEILLEAGKLDEAVQRAGEAFEILATLGTIDEGEAYVRLIHARAELAAGRIETGRLRLAHARDKLLAKASSMSSAHFRTIFLSSVVENVATLSLAARVCR